MRKFVLGCWIFCAFWALGIGYAYHYGIRYNPTDSIPIGFWKLDKTHESLKRGQIVSICPVDTEIFRLGRFRQYYGSHGMCQNGYQPLIKPIAALPGDRVVVTKEAVLVNGEALQNSAPRAKDSNGRPMPQAQLGVHTVPAGSVWLISSYNPRSFDSRYWGPLPIRNIEGIAKPLWVRTEAP